MLSNIKTLQELQSELYCDAVMPYSDPMEDELGCVCCESDTRTGDDALCDSCRDEVAA